MILGRHTVADLQDLLSAKDGDMFAIDRGYADFGPMWSEQEPRAHDAWLNEYQGLLARYGAARADAHEFIERVKADRLRPPPSVVAAESYYEAILRALQREEGKVSPGDKFDIIARLTEAGADLQFTPSQPVAKDWDLLVYNNGGKILEKIDPGLVGKTGLSTLEMVGIGGLAILLIATLRR